jgi:hypothetical protein
MHGGRIGGETTGYVSVFGIGEGHSGWTSDDRWDMHTHGNIDFEWYLSS